MADKVRIGVAGTSWWADSMYLPALTRHPLADVRAVVGGRPERTREFAAQWAIPAPYDRFEEMLAAEDLDAVVILAPNVHHYPYTMAALERGLHVLCEKPLGMSSAQAREMTETAERRGLVTMCPFTYSFMPYARYTKELVDEGFIGRPYHLNMRYFADYGRSGEYIWRFDLGEAGAGISGDLGSHWSYIATWLFGEVRVLGCLEGTAVGPGCAIDDTPEDGRDLGDDPPRVRQRGYGQHPRVVGHTSPRGSGSSTSGSCMDRRARSTSCATGTRPRRSAASTSNRVPRPVAAPGGPPWTCSRSPTGSTRACAGTPSTTRIATPSASTTAWPAGS